MSIQRVNLILSILFLVGTTNLVSAQTGPAGVGNLDGSSGQPKNVFWLDASTLSGLSNDDAVTLWSDQSGNNLDFGPVGATATPFFRNDGLSGSTPVVRFDGTRRYLGLADSDEIDADLSELSIIIVARHATLDGQPRALISKRVNSGSEESYSVFTHSSRDLFFDIRNTNGNRARSSTSLTEDTDYIHTTMYDGSNQRIYLLGESDGSRSVSGSGSINNTTASIILGALNEGYNHDLDGDIAEIIMYDKALSDANRLIVENYLSQKYNITITNDFFGNSADYDSSYGEDIRGIGSDGTNTRTNSSSSDALTLREANNSLDAGEYVMFAHDGTTHVNNSTNNITDPSITNRWARDWYVEVNQGGGLAGVNGGDISVEMVFDFDEAGFASPGGVTGRVLLYRPTLGDDFNRVFTDSYTLEGSDKIVVNVPSSRLKTGYYTLGIGTPLTAKTWYVFQDGNWGDPTTWTTDASTAPLFKNTDSETPAAADEVIIRSGRTVTIQAGTDDLVVNQIKVDGTLDVTITAGHNFTTINGSGVIRIAGNNPGGGLVDNLPDGVVTGNIGFADADNGGTVVVDAAGDIMLDHPRTFKNLRIELDNNSDKAILRADITLNGDFEIRNGDFQFGDGTTAARNLMVFGNVVVINNGSTRIGSISTSTANTRHTFTLHGDFTNQGGVRFTNRADFASDTERRNPGNSYYSSEANNGIVDVVFASDNANQTVNCNGSTYFYRIVVDKGVDDTYVLSLQASNEANFRLLGFANEDVNSDQQTATENTNAFALINGTAEIRPNVEVPVLNRTGNYAISSTARLWVNGGDVRKTSATAIVPYGIVQVTAGYLEATGNSGLTVRKNGLVRVEGGSVLTNQIRTSTEGSGSLGGYSQSEGTVTVDGNLGGANNDYYLFSLTYPGNVFIMSGGTLRVKGAINLSSASAPSNETHGGLIFINSDPGNQSVTGGTVSTEVSTSNGPQKITSRAPFYNFTVANTISSSNASAKISVMGGTSGDNSSDKFRKVSAQNLIVLNDLTIETGTTRNDGANTYGGYLDLCPDGTTCYDLEVGRNLTIEDNGVLDVFTNVTDNVGSATVMFNGTQNGIFHIGDITSLTHGLTGYDDPGGSDNIYDDYRLPLFSMIVDKPGDTLQLAANGPVNSTSGDDIISGEKNIRATKSRLIYVRDQFAIRNGATLNQIDPSGDGLGYSMRLYTDTLELDGNLFIYEQGVNPTNAFVEFGGGNGTITINSTATSSIGNIVIELLNDEIELTSDLSVGRFGYRHGGVNLGTHNLKINLLDLNPEDGGNNDNERLRTINNTNNQNREFIFGVNGSDANQFFYTAGNASDGGLSLKVPRQTNIEGTDGTDNVDADPNFNDIHFEYQNRNLLWFPIGVDSDDNGGGTVGKYTPAIAYLHTTGTTSGDEYITVRPVDGELQTTDLGGGDILSHYWNVDFEGYASSEEPTVSWLFQYDDTDVDASTESNYVPGKVLDGGSYTRSDDGNTNAVKDGGQGNKQGDIIGNNPRNIIIFNGSTNSATDNINSVNQKVFNTIPSGGSGQVDSDPTNTNWQNAFPGTGFTLENANYTAGVAARFVGAPNIYYTKGRDRINRQPRWDAANTWTRSDLSGFNTSNPHLSTNPNSPDTPGAGDVAVIGFFPFDDPETTYRGYPHSARVNSGNLEAATLIFTQMTDALGNAPVERKPLSAIGGDNHFQFRPTLTWNSTGSININQIEGEGAIRVRGGSTNDNNRDPSFANVDLGAFSSQDSSYLLYEIFQNGVALNNVPEVLPNLLIGTDGWGGNNRNISIASDFTTNQNLEILGNANLVLPTTATGNATVNGDLYLYPRFDRTGGAELRFQNSGTSRTVTVRGNVYVGDPSGTGTTGGNVIRVASGGNVEHNLIVGGNIVVNTTGSNNATTPNGNGLLLGSSTDARVTLTVNTVGNHLLSVVNGDTPTLSRLVVNKGSDTSSSFTLNDDANFPLPSDINAQPVEILNGLLTLNDAAIDVTFTDASTGDFFLPNTANTDASSGSGGLEIQQGVARINGDDTGIILDGLLRISGGELDMDDDANNGNNFIEYSSSGEARIEITDGTLTVGSQIRRGLNSTTGVLQYSQTGGTVLIGKNAVAESNRGMFEVTNAGSSFEHTAGSLTLARDNNSTTVPSLLLQPETNNIADGTVITIGNGDTPANQDRFGIQSNIELTELALASSSIAAKLYNLPLTTKILNIENGATFDANGFDLTISESLNSNGTFVTSGNSTNNQTTYFSTTETVTITGIGTTNFWNFEKQGSGILTLSKHITVDNNAFIYEGTLNTQTSAFNIKKDLLHDAIHTSDAAGPGIVFNGNQQQKLDRSGTGTSEIGVMELDNASGLIITDSEENFRINGKLTLSTGIFDVGGNLIELSESAVIENGSGGTSVADFNANNMIQTNSAIRDFGIRKRFNAVNNGSESFAFPVGLITYTPVVLDITNISASSITVRPVRDSPPTAEDTENNPSTCNDPNITDTDNVLQYYWIIKSSGVSGFDGEIRMYYDADDVRITNANGSTYTIDNYGPARLYNAESNWDKVFVSSDFDESNQQIIFPFNGNSDPTLAGIYTAGVTLRNDGTTLLCGGAIPDVVPTFTTDGAGGGDFFDNTTYLGEEAPIAGETPDIIISNGDVLVFNQNSIRARKITIELGGTLVIQNGTNNHNLGFVTGEGTLRLESSGISVLFPTGDYENFFPDGTCAGGGGLEYAGTGSYAVLSDLPNIRWVIFSGSGNRVLPNNFALKVCEDFDIRGTTNIVIPDGNSTVTVRGDVYKSDVSSFDNGGGDSHITMAGSSSQIISGSFTGGNAFNELEINNSTGVTIDNAADVTRGISANQDVEITKELVLTNGRISTNAGNSLRILASTGATTSGGSTTSYVNGPLQAVLNDNQSFTFPVGRSNRFGQLVVNDATHTGEVLTWQAEYFRGNAQNDGRVSSMTDTDDPSIESISRGEYWVVTDDAGTAPSGSVSSAIGLSWNAGGDLPGDVTTLTVMVWDATGSEWDNYGGTNHSANGSGGTFVNTTNVPEYVPFSERIITMGTTEPSVLPVEFLEFTAKAQQFSVLLNWKTAAEINNDFFEVQRSKDGKSWEAIGVINGSGNSSTVLSYSYKDENPLVGVIYYRLRQVDFDGKFEYSKITSVEVDGFGSINASVLDIQIYPNPTKGVINLQIEGLPSGSTAVVKLLDFFGSPLEARQVPAERLVSGIKLNQQGQQPAGLYFVDIQQGSINLQRKIIIR